MEEHGIRQPRTKVPRRTIYFASGETMEEYSTDEEEEDLTKNQVATVDKVGEIFVHSCQVILCTLCSNVCVGSLLCSVIVS